VEARETGSIGTDVLSAYFHAGGGWFIVAIVVLLFGAEQFARVYTDTWVGLWFSDAFRKYDNWFYLGIYFGLGVTYGIITFVRSLRFLYTCVNAGEGWGGVAPGRAPVPRCRCCSMRAAGDCNLLHHALPHCARHIHVGGS
jgi:hypothetical protein